MILDMCCSGRGWWFDKNYKDVIFGDIRRHQDILLNGNGWETTIKIRPSVVFDFRNLPFSNESFDAVLFDPPHIVNGRDTRGFMRHRYGDLNRITWRDDLRIGFKEGFRVLKNGCSLIFKWADSNVSIKEILPLAGRMPLVGHKGPSIKTHWVVYVKHA